MEKKATEQKKSRKKVKTQYHWCNNCHLRFGVKIYIESQVYVNYGVTYCPACGKPLCGFNQDDI
jgi:predicted  nucleic acid-binding Zn-ribbon protein